MGRNGAAEKVAKMPNELYDNLSEAEQTIYDLIGSMGFRPDRDEKTLEWVALSISGDKKIGPKPTLSDLAEAVQAEQPEDAPDKVKKIKADTRGNRYFEGMEPIVDQEIADAAGKYHAIKTERCELTTKEVAAKDELAEVCHRKPHLFKVDPDNSREKIYKVGDLVVRIANEIKEKITTEVVTADD